MPTSPARRFQSPHLGKFGRLPTITVAGAPLLLTQDMVVAYGKRMDTAILSLENDMLSKTVYIDPKALRDRADWIDANVTPPAGLPDPSDFEADKAAQLKALRDTADALETRAKARTADQVAAEESFGTDYELFVARWKTFFNATKAREPSSVLADIFIIAVNPFAGAAVVASQKLTVNSAWTQIEGFESEFSRYYDRFVKLGYTPSAVKPPSASDIAKEHPGGGLGGLLPTIPWGTFAVVGGAVFLGYLWLTGKRGGEATVPTVVVTK